MAKHRVYQSRLLVNRLFTSGLPLDRQQSDRRWLVSADPILEVCNGGVSIRVDSAVRQHSWITFGPQLVQDDSLGYPPRSEQQPTCLEHNLPESLHLP